MQKIIITPNEVAALLGYSESYGRKIIRDLKKKLGKKHITYKTFADDYGFTIEEVMNGVKEKKIA